MVVATTDQPTEQLVSVEVDDVHEGMFYSKLSVCSDGRVKFKMKSCFLSHNQQMENPKFDQNSVCKNWMNAVNHARLSNKRAFQVTFGCIWHIPCSGIATFHNDEVTIFCQRALCATSECKKSLAESANKLNLMASDSESEPLDAIECEEGDYDPYQCDNWSPSMEKNFCSALTEKAVEDDNKKQRMFDEWDDDYEEGGDDGSDDSVSWGTASGDESGPASDSEDDGGDESGSDDSVSLGTASGDESGPASENEDVDDAYLRVCESNILLSKRKRTHVNYNIDHLLGLAEAIHDNPISWNSSDISKRARNTKAFKRLTDSNKPSNCTMNDFWKSTRDPNFPKGIVLERLEALRDFQIECADGFIPSSTLRGKLKIPRKNAK